MDINFHFSQLSALEKNYWVVVQVTVCQPLPSCQMVVPFCVPTSNIGHFQFSASSLILDFFSLLLCRSNRCVCGHMSL